MFNIWVSFGLLWIVLWIVVGLLLVEPLAIIKLPMNPLTWLIAIFLADLSYYWMHRIEHEVRLFWTYNSVHHSSMEFDLTTGLRLAWVEGLIEWIFFVPMVLVGFDAVQVLVSISVVVVYQTWIHTQNQHAGLVG